jgi:hypothetical protein
MTPPDASRSSTPDSASPESLSPEFSTDIAKTFSEAETCLQDFKQEYAKLEAARQAAAAAQDLKTLRTKESDIKTLQTKVEELEWTLAQQMMGMLGASVQAQIVKNARQESFWEFIRYVGLGFVLGVGLKYLIR